MGLVPKRNNSVTFQINTEVVHGEELSGAPSVRTPELFFVTGANCLTLNAGATILSMRNKGEYWKSRAPMSRRSTSGRTRFDGLWRMLYFRTRQGDLR